MSDSNGSGMTADGRYSYSYSINAISSNVAPNDDYPQCPPVRIDNYKALITLTPTGALSSANTIIYQPSVATFSQAPTQSRRSVVVTQTQQEQEQPLNLAYAMPSASTATTRRYSVAEEQPLNLAYAMPSAPRRFTTQEQQQEQPANLAYAMPSQSRQSPNTPRRISVVQQEPAQNWAIASNNSFDTVNNNNNNNNNSSSSNGNTIYVNSSS